MMIITKLIPANPSSVEKVSYIRHWHARWTHPSLSSYYG